MVPALITGTLENPKFEPDMQQFSLMKIKGILPTSDNPFGVLGTLFGHDKQTGTKQPFQSPLKGIDKIFGMIPGGKK